MSEKSALIKTLKEQLRALGMTYRDIASNLKVSEASIKRSFSTESFSLERLISICELAGLTLSALAELTSERSSRIHQLTEKQEEELVSSDKLLLVAVCALNQWSVSTITTKYQLSESECVAQLTKLDRLGVITLFPGNRIRLNVARDFDWIPNGPIRRYFLKYGLTDFINGAFDASGETFNFAHAMLTPQTLHVLNDEVRKLRSRFADLHDASLKDVTNTRFGVGMVVGVREWEIPPFQALRRRG